MKLLLALVVVAASSTTLGCSHRDSRPIVGPDGRQAYAVTCSHGADNCWEEAAERCPHGYTTQNDDQKMGTVAVGSSSSLVALPAQRGAMLIECKD
jgi:hypothetical protein